MSCHSRARGPVGPAALFGLVLLAATLFLAPRASGQSRAIGNDFQGRLWDVDLATGAASNPRPTGIPFLAGIALGPDGVMYGASVFDQSLYRIDPTTSSSALVGALGAENFVEGELAFQPGTGALFAVSIRHPGGTEYSLSRINPATGRATLVAPLVPVNSSDTDLSAMAFAPDGTLYVLNTGQPANNDVEQLLRVDPATAAVLFTVPLTLPGGGDVRIGAVAGLAFDPAGGALYMADGGEGTGAGSNLLYRLDPSTGVLTVVGPLGVPQGLAGLVIVPEPATPVVAASVLALLTFRRRRRIS